MKVTYIESKTTSDESRVMTEYESQWYVLYICVMSFYSLGASPNALRDSLGSVPARGFV